MVSVYNEKNIIEEFERTSIKKKSSVELMLPILPNETLFIIFEFLFVELKIRICKYKRIFYLEETRKKMKERNEYIYYMYENFITPFEIVLYMKNQEELKKYEKIISLRKNNLLYNVSKIFLETHCTLMYYLVEENNSLSMYNKYAKERRRKEKTFCEKCL